MSNRTTVVEGRTPHYARLAPSVQLELIKKVNQETDDVAQLIRDLAKEYDTDRRSIRSLLEEEVEQPYIKPAPSRRCDNCRAMIQSNYCIACFARTGEIHGESHSITKPRSRHSWTPQEKARLTARVKKYRSRQVPYHLIGEKLGISTTTALAWART